MKATRVISAAIAFIAGYAISATPLAATTASSTLFSSFSSAGLSLQGGKGEPAKGGDPKGADASAKKTPPKDDPKVDDLLKQIKKLSKGKVDGDAEGVRVLDELASKYDSLNPKQQKAVAKGVGEVFNARRKPDEVVLYLSAGEALSRFGDNGAEALAKVVKDKRFTKKDWSTMRSQIVRLLGRPADKRYVDLLLDIALKDNDDQARGKAGEALGSYARYDQGVRKNIFEKLVKSLEEAYAKSKENLDPNDLAREVWVQRYAAIQDPWMKSLTRLTGQSIKDVQEWTKWWNDNKRSNWDKEGFRSEAPKGDESK